MRNYSVDSEPVNKPEIFDVTEAGIKAGVATALEKHKSAGRVVVIWRDDEVAEALEKTATEAKRSA